MTNVPTPYAAARIAAFLSEHLCWSVFWDKRKGLWRAARAEPGLVEPLVDRADLAAHVSDLDGQGGQALGEDTGRGLSGRGHDLLPFSPAFR